MRLKVKPIQLKHKKEKKRNAQENNLFWECFHSPHPYSSKIHAVEIVPQTSSFLQLLSVQHKVTVSAAEGTQRLNPQGLVYSLIVTLDRKPTFFQALRATSWEPQENPFLFLNKNTHSSPPSSIVLWPLEEEKVSEKESGVMSVGKERKFRK